MGVRKCLQSIEGVSFPVAVFHINIPLSIIKNAEILVYSQLGEENEAGE